MSKNGISSSCLNSMVNLILLWLFKCCKNSGHSDVKQYVKVPSRRRNQTKGEGQTWPFMTPLVLLNLRKVLPTGIQPVFRTKFDRSYAYFSHVFIYSCSSLCIPKFSSLWKLLSSLSRFNWANSHFPG